MIATTCSSLVAALKSAAAGAVLALPPGQCAMPVLNGVNPSGVVTITSQDPANPAILAGDFKVVSSSNLTFSRLIIDLSTSHDPYWAGRVSDVKNLTFDHIEARSNGPVDWPGGFNVTDSDHLSVTNSKFHDIGMAVFNILRSTNTTISGNDFYRWDKSAVGGAQLEGFTFTDNDIHDAHPVVGTHADGLQIFTAGTKLPSSNVVVSNNQLWTGGGYPFQGIFIQDELGSLPIAGVTVTNNVLYGTMWDSIWLNGVTGTITVTNNRMASWTQVDIGATKDLAKPVKTAFTANLEISVAKGATLTVRGNIAQNFSDSNGKYIPGLPGNTKLGVYSPASKPPWGRAPVARYAVE